MIDFKFCIEHKCILLEFVRTALLFTKKNLLSQPLHAFCLVLKVRALRTRWEKLKLLTVLTYFNIINFNNLQMKFNYD